MNDPRQRAMDLALGGGVGAGPMSEEAAPEAPEAASGMECPVCGARFELKPEEAPAEAAAAPEEMGGM